MKNPRRKISRLAKDASDDEIIRWTNANDVFDRLEAGLSEMIEDHSDLDAVLHEAIFQDNTAQLNMRLPPAMKAVLSKLARERTTDATTLARIWLAERLKRERREDSIRPRYWRTNRRRRRQELPFGPNSRSIYSHQGS